MSCPDRCAGCTGRVFGPFYRILVSLLGSMVAVLSITGAWICASTSLADFASRRPRLLVLTGAGCSTDSDIPDYRDVNGDWEAAGAGHPPSLHRRRAHATPLLGTQPRRLADHGDSPAWRLAPRAGPIRGLGRVGLLLTQNVDGLHDAAGSRQTIDLHGRIDTVRCLGCETRTPRAEMQQSLLARNPAWAALEARAAPDGDADVDDQVSPSV
jgi:hypothetical protein